MNERLLIVEDEETLCDSLKRVLSREGYVVDTVGNAEAAFEVFEKSFYNVIITDIILPGITGIELLKRIKDQSRDQIVIIMTAYASLETAVEALRNGAYDYVVKPVLHEEIKQIVKNALKQGALQEENFRLRRQLERQYDLNRIVGESPAMQRVMSEVGKIAASKDDVLLRGEIGTGRELIARAIHLNSGRSGGPFISINLRDISAGEAERALFGYVKGAFPEALSARKGLFEEANGGTVFLREICDLDSELQTRLMQVLRDREIRPAGSETVIKADLRFITATSRDITDKGRERELNSELLDKFGNVAIDLPPLRERKEDIRPLTEHFISKYSRELCKNIERTEAGVVDFFLGYEWPGNVRELQNIIERAVILSADGVIRPEHLPRHF
jgi:two-component system, NtrC family, response regulator AtoC